MSVRVFAPAKINLTLKVGRSRADGLHPLQSVVVFADVGDVIEAASADMLSLSIDGEFAADLAADDSNLVLRAARALAQSAGVDPAGAAIVLQKNLPIASGIGGGSSDAAAALRTLNELWGLGFDTSRLAQIAQSIGADVPVCLVGAPSYVTGVGESCAPIAAPSFAAVLVNPRAPLATADVYRAFDRAGLGASLAEAAPPSWTDRAAALSDIAACGNDLDAPARSLLPVVGDIAAALRSDARVRYAGLSGSGATMFALVDDGAAAEALATELQQRHPAWWIADTTLAGA